MWITSAIVWLLIVHVCAIDGSPSINAKPWSDYPELPLELIGKNQNQVVTGPAIGPPLRPYSEIPVAHKLTTSSDSETRVGKQLNLKVNTFESRDNIKTCSWTSPDGTYYIVDGTTTTVDGE